jgi:hypothetical protein
MKDLANVEIVVGKIEDLGESDKFDLILISGVLEYIGGQNATFWLSSVVDHLKQDGTLFLAIENRIGLKYWLGFSEDHTGKLWDGIEDYGGSDLPRTYTKKELSGIVELAGLSEQNFFYPYPDYKKPRQIISEAGVKSLNSEYIFSLISNPFADYTGKSKFNLDKKAAFKTIIESGLMSDLANSFIIIASKSSSSIKLFNENMLLVRCDSSVRKKQFRRWKYLYSKSKSLNQVQSAWHISKAGQNETYEVADFVDGFDFLTQFHSAIDLTAKEDLIILWLKAINTLKEDLQPFDSNSMNFRYLQTTCTYHEKISVLDLGFSNFIFSNKNLQQIDLEWQDKNGICLELALYRALYYCPEVIDAVISESEGEPLNLGEKIAFFYSKYVSNLPEHSISDFLTSEIQFLSKTHMINEKFQKKFIRKTLQERKRFVRLTEIRSFYFRNIVGNDFSNIIHILKIKFVNLLRRIIN